MAPRWPDSVRRTVSTYRKLFEDIRAGEVTWQPYAEYLDEEKEYTTPQMDHDKPLWLAKVPLIHFWMVEWHLPDRVMRQFGLRQTISPPRPTQSWEEHELLLSLKHSKEDHDRRPDWRIRHITYIQVLYLTLQWFKIFPT